MQKWNWETQEYELYEVPDDWFCPIYLDNMMAVVNCASCGQKMIYGIGYTSREIHNHMGFGYWVCEDCYQKEITREQNKKRSAE